MKASFDGARKNLARAYNEMYHNSTLITDEYGRKKRGVDEEEVMWLRSMIGNLLCMHDPNVEDDCTMLADSVTLLGGEDDE